MRTTISKQQNSQVPSGDKPNGFTLIELLVAMAILSLVIGSIVGVYAALSRSYTTQNVAADVQQVVRAAVDYMAEDLMMAGLNPEDIADVGFQEATTSKLQFTANRNMDGDTDDDFENITYELADNQLKQTDHLGNQVLLGNLDEARSEFVYLDIDGNDLGSPVGDLAAIRTVMITLSVREPAGRSGMLVRAYTTRIRCRNLGL
jgi:prepilin-type N-terminal cleavage/methylation domain-containing protein